MLRTVPIPPRAELTARAALFAYPATSATAPQWTGDEPDAAEQWPLDPQRLMELARQQTGLADFGAEPLREPLHVL
jgi:hypothetical protein